MENNVNVSVIATNRKPLSIIGSNLGTQYFKAESRACHLNYDADRLKVEQGGNVELILNRSPRRYRLTGHDVTSVMIANDATGTTKCYLNKDTESEVSIPVTAGMEKIGVVTEGALGKALRGDTNMIFSDPKKLAAHLNQFNNDEKGRLMAIRDGIDKMIRQLESAIAENIKKADQYCSEIVSSAPETVPGATTTVIVTPVED